MPVIGLPEREQSAVHDFAKGVRAGLGANLVELRLFGSRARGEAAPDSDIDVLVVVSGDRVHAEDRVIDVAFDVNLAYDLYISPRVVTAASLRDPVWRTTSFVKSVEREGVVL